MKEASLPVENGFEGEYRRHGTRIAITIMHDQMIEDWQLYIYIQQCITVRVFNLHAGIGLPAGFHSRSNTQRQLSSGSS